jgi:Tfp pilus assembly protein PilN
MNKSDTHAFINQLLVYTLVMICFSGSVGLGTVWLRHQISVSANHIRQLNTRITELDRREAELKARIASEQSTTELQRKNLAFSLGLVSPQETQIVRVTESPEERLLAKRNQGIFELDHTRVVPVRFSLAGGSR